MCSFKITLVNSLCSSFGIVYSFVGPEKRNSSLNLTLICILSSLLEVLHDIQLAFTVNNDHHADTTMGCSEALLVWVSILQHSSSREAILGHIHTLHPCSPPDRFSETVIRVRFKEDNNISFFQLFIHFLPFQGLGDKIHQLLRPPDFPPGVVDIIHLVNETGRGRDSSKTAQSAAVVASKQKTRRSNQIHMI